MKIIKTEYIDSFQKESIYKLWNAEYPSTIAYSFMAQLDVYLNSLDEAAHYFLMDEDAVSGWAITFVRDNEKWFAIIIDKYFQREGLGAVLLGHLKENEVALNGWAINEGRYFKSDGTAYKSPIEFYIKNGFTIVENARLDIPQIKAVKIRWERGIE